jgi:hypothetical protein
MTRGELQTAVLSWLHRANFRSAVPDFDAVGNFISLAEQDVNLDLRARCMVVRTEQPIDAGPQIPLPCDYIEGFRIGLVGGGELLYEPSARIGEGDVYLAYAEPEAITYASSGPPRSYTVIGDIMEIRPWSAPPDPLPAGWMPWTVRLDYYARQSLGPNLTDTTRVLTNYPGVYLYGALLQAAPFLRDDSRLATWQTNYQSTIFRANAEHERARSQGSRLVARYGRQPRLSRDVSL